MISILLYKPRILFFKFLVEDSTVNRRLLDRMLFRLGYNSVVQASNGLEALNMAQRSSEHFDIILLDLSMSVMDGLSFLSHVKQLRPVSLVNTVCHNCWVDSES